MSEGERLGRPSRLNEHQLTRVEAALRDSPSKVGLPTEMWDGPTLSEFLRCELGVSLKVRQCQRLFRQLGFRLRKPRPQVAQADPQLDSVPEGEGVGDYWWALRFGLREAGVISCMRGKSARYDGGWPLFADSGFGCRRRCLRAEEVEFTAIEQLPLDLFSRGQADSGGQGQGEAHIEPGVLSARPNRLDPQRIGSRHFVGSN